MALGQNAEGYTFRTPVAAGYDAELEIGLVSGSQLGRELIVQWLEKVADRCRIAVFGAADELLSREDDATAFDLIVLGQFLSDAPAEELVATVQMVHEKHPAVPIVVVAGSEDRRLIDEALLHGVRCFIPTRLPVPVAIAAVQVALSGGTYAPPAVGYLNPSPAGGEARDATAAATPAVGPRPSGAPDIPPFAEEALARLRLSPRESQVLRLLQIGLSNKQIGQELKISENTVMVHVRHLMRKLGARNRTQAVFKANTLLEAAEKGSNPS